MPAVVMIFLFNSEPRAAENFEQRRTYPTAAQCHIHFSDLLSGELVLYGTLPDGTCFAAGSR